MGKEIHTISNQPIIHLLTLPSSPFHEHFLVTLFSEGGGSLFLALSYPRSLRHDEIPRILFVPRRNRSRKIETCSETPGYSLHIPRNEDFIGKFPRREPGRVLVILPASIHVLSFTAHPPPTPKPPRRTPTFWTTCSRCDPASGGWGSRRQRAGQKG